MLAAFRAGPLAAALAESSEIVIGARGGASARVAAVHRRAVTVLLRDGRLVTLLPAGTPLHPWAVTLDFEPLLAALPRERLRISLAGAEIVPLRLTRRPGRLSSEVLELLSSAVPPLAGADPFESRLAGALARFRDGGEISGLATLIGLGPGLTPAG